jgi:hypothetical protein
VEEREREREKEKQTIAEDDGDKRIVVKSASSGLSDVLLF